MENKKKNFTDTPVNYCPACEHKIDAAIPNEDPNHVPEKGDISVCWYCSQALIFNEDLTIRSMTEKELKALPFKFRISIAASQKSVIDRRKNE